MSPDLWQPPLTPRTSLSLLLVYVQRRRGGPCWESLETLRTARVKGGGRIVPDDDGSYDGDDDGDHDGGDEGLPGVAAGPTKRSLETAATTWTGPGPTSTGALLSTLFRRFGSCQTVSVCLDSLDSDFASVNSVFFFLLLCSSAGKNRFTIEKRHTRPNESKKR
jgi:hypothetical protein